MPKRNAAQKKSSKPTQESQGSRVWRKAATISAFAVDTPDEASETFYHCKEPNTPEEACSRPATAIAPLNAGESNAVDAEKDPQKEHVQEEDSPKATEKERCSGRIAPEETTPTGRTYEAFGAVEVTPPLGVHEGKAAIPTEHHLNGVIADVGQVWPAGDGSTCAKDAASCPEIASEACEDADGISDPLQGGAPIEPEHHFTTEVRSDSVSEETSLGDVQEDKTRTKNMVASTTDETACGETALGLDQVDSDVASTNAAGWMSETSASFSGADIIHPDAVQLGGHSDCPKGDLQSKDEQSRSTLSVQASLPQTCTIRVKCSSTSPGEVVALVGSDENWGSWDITKALELNTDPASFPLWSAEIPMPALGSEFKFAIKKHTGAAMWEPLAQNRKWTLSGPVLIAEFGELC